MCTSCCKPTAADVLTWTKTGQVMWKEGGRPEGERQGVVQTGGGGTGEKRGEGEKWTGDNRLSWKCKQSLSHTGLKVEQRKQLTHAYWGGGKFLNTPTHLWCIALGLRLRPPRAIYFISANHNPHAQFCTCTVLSRSTLDVSARQCYWQSTRIQFWWVFFSLFLTMNHLYSYQFCVHIEHSFRSLKSRSTGWSRQPISAQF